MRLRAQAPYKIYYPTIMNTHSFIMKEVMGGAYAQPTQPIKKADKRSKIKNKTNFCQSARDVTYFSDWLIKVEVV